MPLNALFFQQEKELFLLLASQPAKDCIEALKKSIISRLYRVQDGALLFEQSKELITIFEQNRLDINSLFRKISNQFKEK